MSRTATRQKPPSGNRYGHDELDKVEPSADPRVVLLRHRLTEIDRTLGEIDERLQSTVDAEEIDALRGETIQLQTYRRTTLSAITDLIEWPTSAAAKSRQALIEGALVEQRVGLERWIEKLTSEREWRQAALARWQLIDLREQIEREVKQ